MKIVERDNKLVVVDYNESEVYTIACKIKKDSLKFYGYLSGKKQDAKTKEALQFLIDAEKKHLEFFESRLNFFHHKKADNQENNNLLNEIDYGIFQPFSSIKNPEDVIENSKEALKLAALLKKNSIKFYKECKANVNTLLAEIELDAIITKEENQKELLEDMIKSLEKNNPEKEINHKQNNKITFRSYFLDQRGRGNYEV